jgi:hypothetical protein
MLLKQPSGKPLSTIYLFPALAVGPFNDTQPVKNWAMPPDYVDPNPNPDMPNYILFDVIEVDATGHPFQTKLPLTPEQAKASNPFPPGGHQFPPGFKVVTIPEPLNYKAIPAGYEIGTDILGTVCVVKSLPAPAPTDEVAFTRADHDALMKLAAQLPQ